MSINLTRQLLVTLVTYFIAHTVGLTTYQDWFCWRNGQYNISCDLECSDGLARPAGCEICECRESLCRKPDAVKCDKGWHCEVQKSGNSWFLIDVTVCVPDEAVNESAEVTDDMTQITTTNATIKVMVSSTSETSTTVEAAKTISSVQTTTFTTAATTVTVRPTITITTTATSETATSASRITSVTSGSIPRSTSALRNGTEIPSATCEQRGRCDLVGVCYDQDYDCRSDGRCCKRDSSRPETNSVTPRCQQKPDYGYCKSATSNYIFDIYTSRCIATMYGGCGYSDNFFRSLEECSEICEKPCMQPSSVGPCRANIPRYFYNMTQQRCVLFDYGGCQGNKNNFMTAEACEVQCRMLNSSDENWLRTAGKTHIIFSRIPDSSNVDSRSIGNSSNTNNNNTTKNINSDSNTVDGNVITTSSIAKETVDKYVHPSKNNSAVSNRPYMLPFVG